MLSVRRWRSRWGRGAAILAVLFTLMVAVVPVASAAPAASAATGGVSAARSSKGGLGTTIAAAGGCLDTYWDYGWQNPPGTDGYSWELGIYFLRDANTGAYCGTIYTRVCVTTTGGYPLTWRVVNDTYPNNQWGGRTTTVIDIRNHPGTPGYGCAYSAHYAVARTLPITIVAHLWGFDGSNYGGSPENNTFYAY